MRLSAGYAYTQPTRGLALATRAQNSGWRQGSEVRQRRFLSGEATALVARWPWALATRPRPWIAPDNHPRAPGPLDMNRAPGDHVATRTPLALAHGAPCPLPAPLKLKCSALSRALLTASPSPLRFGHGLPGRARARASRPQMPPSWLDPRAVLACVATTSRFDSPPCPPLGGVVVGPKGAFP